MHSAHAALASAQTIAVDELSQRYAIDGSAAPLRFVVLLFLLFGVVR
jgi:hypothetical protein